MASTSIRAVLLALAIVAPASAAAKTYVAERYDVVLAAQPDGSLLVTETIRFYFQGGPFDHVYRTVPPRRTDGLTFLGAAMDGMPLAQDEVSARRVEIDRKNGRLRVTWRFPKLSDATHTFTLRYRADGVIVPGDAGGAVLQWHALPTERRYPIATAAVRLDMPAGATFDELPGLKGPNGGEIERTATGFVITARNLERRRDLQVRAAFTPAVAVRRPAWLDREARIAANAPQYVRAAIVVAVVGIALFAFLGFRDLRPEPDTMPEADRLVEPPADRPPAIAGALVRGGRPMYPDAVATLYALGARGVVRVVEMEKRHWYQSRDYEIELTPSAVLRPHEEALIHALFKDAVRRGGKARLSDLSKRVYARWATFRSPVLEEMRMAGLIDPARQDVQRRWARIGTALLIAAGATVAYALWIVREAGPAPLLIPLSLGILAAVAFIVSALLSILSDQGVIEARRWKRFRGFLADASRQVGADTGFVERYLPYAIVFGLAGKWAKALKKQGGPSIAPAWFQASSTVASNAAFVALIASSSGSGATGAGAGAGGGGGGAAGGGGSGAG